MVTIYIHFAIFSSGLLKPDFDLQFVKMLFISLICAAFWFMFHSDLSDSNRSFLVPTKVNTKLDDIVSIRKCHHFAPKSLATSYHETHSTANADNILASSQTTVLAEPKDFL